MQSVQRSATTYAVLFWLVAETDHVTPITGATPTLLLSKNGAAFAAAAGSAVEVGNGLYRIANATDFDTVGSCALYVTAQGADPVMVSFRVERSDPYTSLFSLINRLQTSIAVR